MSAQDPVAPLDTDEPEAQPIDLTRAELYLNRHLSLLAFNERVLAQARDPAVPLLERLKFLCITSSNLDEFFLIQGDQLFRILILHNGGQEDWSLYNAFLDSLTFE